MMAADPSAAQRFGVGSRGYDAAEDFAAAEGVLPDFLQAVRKLGTLQVHAAFKGTGADGFNAFRNRDGSQLFALPEGVFLQDGYGFRKREGFQAGAAEEGGRGDGSYAARDPDGGNRAVRKGVCADGDKTGREGDFRAVFPDNAAENRAVAAGEAGGFVQGVLVRVVLQAEGDDRIFVQRGGQGQLSVRVRGEDGGGIILQQDILVNPAPDDAAFLREQLIADPVFHAVFDGAEVRTDGAYQPGTVIKRVVSDFGQAAGQGDNARVRFAEGLVSDLRQGAGQGDLRQRPAVVEGLFADDGDAFFQHNAPQACTGAEGLFLHGIHAAGNGHGGEPGSGEGELSEVVQVFRQGNAGQFSAVHECVVPEEGQVCRKGDGSKIFTVL